VDDTRKTKEQLVDELSLMRRRVSQLESLEAELKRAQKALRVMDSTVESSINAVAMADLQGKLTYVNPSFMKLWGYDHDSEILSRPAVEFWAERDIAATIVAALSEKGGWRGELTAVRKDGTSFDVQLSASMVTDSEGVPLRMMASFIDVTEQKRTKESLLQSEQRFRAIAEAMPVPAGITRLEDGLILYVNKHFGPTFGIAPEEAIGRRSHDFYLDPDDRRTMLEALTQVGYLREYELRTKKADGTPFWVIASLQPLVFEGEQALLTAFFDLTERKQTEEKLRHLYEQERGLTQQLEAEIRKRVEFTRALTHELKTPLTSVLASSDLLLSQLHEEPLLSLARNIGRSATNLNSRIDELLDLARGEVGMLELKLESTDLLQLLRDVAENMAPLASGNEQTLILDLPPSLPSVQADGARLQQVVTNLLSNAIKFTPGNGKITISAGHKDANVTVEVHDTGRGISKEEQERLFQPYYRVESDRNRLSGLGLGLSLSKTLVELHGGQIWVKSQTGKGSTFGFSLPSESAVEQAEEREKASKLWKVLIIEDDQEIIESVSMAFQLRWPEAALISTRLGEKGIDLVESEDPDVVILDLGLPDVSGFDVLQQIRVFSSVPIVILSVKTDEAEMVKGLEWGADDYVVKPFRHLELLERLRVQVRKQAPSGGEPLIVCGPLRFDPTTNQLSYGSKEISLTIIEGRIIQHLMRNAGHVVTHSRLAEAVWGDDYPGAIDSLRVYIRRLRGKLEEDPKNPKLILTKAGIGYFLAKPV
jgi:PAS domain S-box-containing protein